MTNRLKAFMTFGVIVAIAIAVYVFSSPTSSVWQVLDFPLSPGAVAALLLTGHGGGPKVVGYLIVWLFDTGLYWLAWEILVLVFKRLLPTNKKLPT